MVRIEYIDGTEEIIETMGNKTKLGHYTYDSWEEAFVVFDHADYIDCMRVPREFVKSIRHIKV